MLVEPILCKNSWIWIPIGAPVKFRTCFPTWTNNRNPNFQEKLQNGLCSCTSWSNVWHTIEMFDTYPDSSWYKLLKNKRKSWNNQKSYFTILDKNTQKRILWVTGLWNRGPLKILNGIKLILDDQGNHLDSYTISLESFRPFRGPIFRKPVTGQELFFAVSYSKPALVA